MTSSRTATVTRGIPLVDIGKEDIEINADVNTNGKILINGKDILGLMYPIGSIYFSIKNTNPSSLFGGTWVAWGAGRVPVGVDTSADFKTVEKTGGAKTHTLTIAQMPAHSHKIWYQNNSGYDNSSDATMAAVGKHFSTPVYSTETVGGGAAHNNLQPYITCYMWKRTA